MNDQRLSRRRVLIGCLLTAAFLLLGAAGCGGSVTATPAPARPVTPSPAAPKPTAAPTAVGSATNDVLTLTWWLPEFLTPQAPEPAGPAFTKQLEAFTAAQGGKVRVLVAPKARYGKGGLLDYLRSAQPVAAGVLPDLVALDVAELEKAVAAGVLQPLDPLLDGGVVGGLYAFASEAGQYGGKLYAVQFLSDVDHATYLPSQVAEPPAGWADILAHRTTYLFPLAALQAGSSGRPAEDLSHAVLSQYLSAGATLGTDRRLVLEAQPLLRLLTFYQDGLKAGLLPPSALEMGDGEAVWSVFSQGQVPLAYASARRYWAENGTLSAGFAAAPGMTGPATPIAGGWALAVVTTDPQRQRAAADLITWLLQPENASAWSAASGWLPTSPAAVQLLDDSPYRDFLDTQLAAARALPGGADYAGTAARIQAAIVSVLKGGSDASAATEAAINAGK